MPASNASSPTSRPSRRRFAAPLLTVIAALAGLTTGRLFGQPGSDILVVGLIVIAGLCSIAAWVTVQPERDALTAIGLDAFRAELDRARRHRRTFAMARLELATPADGVAAPDEPTDIDTATIQLVGGSLRITDHAWLDDGDVVILLPESDRATAESFAERVRANAPGRFTERMGIAAFPDDGLTSNALLDALERGMHGAPMPSPMVRTTVAGAATDLATVGATVGEQVESGIG
jgi:hypothetical protein